MGEVLYSKQASVATITINRAQRRNSLTSQVVNMLRASLARANADPEVRVIVLTAEGDTVFCAGGDLGRDTADAGAMARYASNKELVELFEEIRNLKRPIIARVNGHALGIGFALVLACDMAIVEEGARMSCPEMKVGVFPIMEMSHLLRHIGPKKAMEILLTAKRITANQALELGLINDVVAREDLDLKVQELVSQIADFSPVAIRIGRDSFYARENMGFDESLDYLLSQLTLILQTEDAKEGAQAFLQKRKAEWKGK